MPANPDANPPTDRVPGTKTLNETFQINSAKLYAPVVTSYIKNNLKFLESIKQRFKKIISWNKYRSEITT